MPPFFCHAPLPHHGNVYVFSRPIVEIVVRVVGVPSGFAPVWPKKVLGTLLGPVPSAHVLCQPGTALKSGSVNAYDVVPVQIGRASCRERV